MRLLAILLFTAALPVAAEDFGSQMDAFARRAMAAAGEPAGLTVAVVQGERVVHRADYGFRDVEGRLPVTPETRFYVASTTKAFTAMMALVLATEGTIDLDAPVTKWWAELVLTPPLDASRISLRDVLAMRPRFSNATYNFREALVENIEDDAELLRVLAAYSSPEPPVFTYSNMSYDFAAEVIERAAKKSWQELSEEKVFAPLGMRSTTSAVPAGAIAVAHLYSVAAGGSFVRNRDKTDAAMGPAGGTYTTSGDAARWLVAMLNEGRVDGRQALPVRAVRAAQSFQTSQQRRYAYFDRWGWGFGHDLGEYEGELFVHRFGGFNGAFSHLSFMPDRKLGVAVFSNGGSAAANAVAAYAYDLLLGKSELDAKWSAELARIEAAARKAREESRSRRVEVPEGRPAHPLHEYAGAYHYHRLGQITVVLESSGLVARWGILAAPLRSAGEDEFLVDWSGEGQPVRIAFQSGEGRVTRIVWGDRVFERVSP